MLLLVLYKKVFALFSVTLSVSTHLCVVCRPFSVFQIRDGSRVNHPTKKAYRLNR